MIKPSVYADFNNVDPEGRLRLNVRGTFDALTRQNLQLEEGMSILVCDDELEADATARFSKEERIWVAVIDWDLVREKSASTDAT